MITKKFAEISALLKSTTPQVHIITVNKDIVDALLALNVKNRVVKKEHLKGLTQDIKSSRFFLTASGVGVSKSGVLLDGQHRLLAIKAAGYPPVQIVLAVGLEEESQMVVDRHAKRSLSDALSLHMDAKISSHMVALANALRALGATKKPSCEFVFSPGSAGDSMIADFMADHAKLAFDVVAATSSARASVCAAIFVYALHKPDEAFEFARDVAKGINLMEDHPAYRLRMAIDRLKNATGASARMELFKLAASACMAHSNRRTLKSLKPSSSWAEARWNWAIEGASLFESN